jgi:hypothetical protein
MDDNLLPGQGGTGDRLVAVLTRDFELSPAELALLMMVRSALNRRDELEIEVADHGLIDAETGRATGAAVELRLVTQEAAKLLAGLHVPDELTEEAGYNPRAPRGPRGPNGGHSLRVVDGDR